MEYIILSGLFAAKLFIAELLFLWTYPKRPLWGLRWLLCCGVLVLFEAVNPFTLKSDTVPSLILFVVLFVLSVLCARICFACPVVPLLFGAIAGYLTEHFASQITKILTMADIVGSDSYATGQVVASIFSMALIYPLFYFLFARQIRNGEHPNINNRRLMLFVSFSLFLCVLLSVLTQQIQNDLNSLEPSVSFQVRMICIGYALLGCMMSLMLLLGLLSQGRLQSELAISEFYLQQQKKQYQISQENINLINMKCHDLKHQISALRGHFDESAIREIEDMIGVYDASIRTGNEALDVILTEKSLYCQQHRIRFSCIADGEKLSFMEPGDIYSLSGNMISNAIEALEQLPDPDQREFSLDIRQVGNFVVITEENPYTGPITFTDGLPETTKSDRNYHGLGMKSIRRVVEKYGGQMLLETSGQVFRIKIVFPAEPSD